MKLNLFDATTLYCGSPYICTHNVDGRKEVTLDGIFYAENIEAIAAWMRDPKGVAEGIDK